MLSVWSSAGASRSVPFEDRGCSVDLFSILKFADDTKLFKKVKEIGDKQYLQDYIDKLVKWSEKWQMLFNFGKCKCLHTRVGKYRYEL